MACSADRETGDDSHITDAQFLVRECVDNAGAHRVGKDLKRRCYPLHHHFVRENRTYALHCIEMDNGHIALSGACDRAIVRYSLLAG